MKISSITIGLFACSALTFGGCSKGGKTAANPSTASAAANPCAADATANPCEPGATANPCATGAAANPCASGAAANPCASGAAAANPCAGGSSISDEDMENAIVLMEAIADAMDTNKDDCDKMAVELTKLIDGNKDLLAKTRASKDDDDAKDRFQAKYKPRLEAMMGKMMSGMQKCATHAGVRDAMKAME